MYYFSKKHKHKSKKSRKKKKVSETESEDSDEESAEEQWLEVTKGKTYQAINILNIFNHPSHHRIW